VAYATADGTALAGSDYTASSDDIIFTTTDTQVTFTIPTVDDGINEGDEAFSVSLFDPIYAVLGDPASAVVTITDNDPLPEIVLATSTYFTSVDGVSVTVTVQISGTRSMDATVDYSTSDETALAGSDYTATSGTLTFTPTDTEKTFKIPILDDDIYEGDEAFAITLSNPSDATLGTPAEATVTISEDDQATADLSMAISDLPDPVFVGGVITYTIIVENLGPQDAIAVELTDTLPVGLEYLSASGADWICGELGGIVTCELGLLESGVTSTLEILVKVPLSAGEIINTAQVSSSVPDPNLDNNQETETTHVEMRKIFLPIILR
jgi:uncharacterized repeat protein (TIGR01451 family)